MPLIKPKRFVRLDGTEWSDGKGGPDDRAPLYSDPDDGGRPYWKTRTGVGVFEYYGAVAARHMSVEDAGGNEVAFDRRDPPAFGSGGDGGGGGGARIEDRFVKLGDGPGDRARLYSNPDDENGKPYWNRDGGGHYDGRSNFTIVDGKGKQVSLDWKDYLGDGSYGGCGGGGSAKGAVAYKSAVFSGGRGGTEPTDPVEDAAMHMHFASLDEGARSDARRKGGASSAPRRGGRHASWASGGRISGTPTVSLRAACG